MLLCYKSEQTVEQTLNWPVIRDAMTVIWRRPNVIKGAFTIIRLQVYFANISHSLKREKRQIRYKVLILQEISRSKRMQREKHPGQMTGPELIKCLQLTTMHLFLWQTGCILYEQMLYYSARTQTPYNVGMKFIIYDVSTYDYDKTYVSLHVIFTRRDIYSNWNTSHR